jgi:hypothetical protein
MNAKSHLQKQDICIKHGTEKLSKGKPITGCPTADIISLKLNLDHAQQFSAILKTQN